MPTSGSHQVFSFGAITIAPYAGYTYDHMHRHVSDKGVPYEFKDGHQLLADFFAEVDRVLKEARK